MCVSVITLICYTNIITPTFNHTHRMHKKEFSTVIGGKTLTATFSDLAERANGSVLIRYGNTVILATAVMSQYQKEGGDFFPLTVDFEEKFYASGRILGSRYVRREGKPSDEAILSGRIVDRTIRPLFAQWIRNEVQVIITVLSIDEDDPDILGVLGASLALGIGHSVERSRIGSAYCENERHGLDRKPDLCHPRWHQSIWIGGLWQRWQHHDDRLGGNELLKTR